MKQLYITVLIAAVVVLGGAFLAVRSLYPVNQLASPGSLKDPVILGAALGLSGECANYGEGERRAVELAIKEANDSGGIQGRPITLKVEDTLCTAEGSVSAMQKLINVDHVEAVVGVTWGDSYQAGFTINNTEHIPAIAPSAALEALLYNDAPIDYVYSTWFPEKDEISALQRYAALQHDREFVTIHDTDTYGSMLASLFNKESAANGISVSKDYEVLTGTNDFRTTIAQIKQQPPKAIGLFFQAPSQKAAFLKQAKEMGLHVRVYTDASIEDDSLLHNFGDALEGVVYTRPISSGNFEAFSEEYKATYGDVAIGASDANAYDAARTLIAALQDHSANGSSLTEAIARIDIPGTAVERIRFDDSHQITGAEFDIKTVRNGQFVAI